MATAKRATAGFAGLAIGLCLTLIHLISIPATNTSVSPARSTGVVVLGPEIAMGQLWLFWLAPIAGALLGAVIYRGLLTQRTDDEAAAQPLTQALKKGAAYALPFLFSACFDAESV